MGCRTNGLSDQWAVGPMGVRTNGLSDHREVTVKRNTTLQEGSGQLLYE